jgi:hypothetical protein
MKTNPIDPFRTAVCSIAVTLLAVPSLVLAQDQQAPPPDAQQQTPPPSGAWRRVGEPANQPAPSNPRSTMDPNYGQGSNYGQSPNYGPPPAYGQGAGRYPNQPTGPYNPGPIPPRLTIKPGTLVTVRLNQGLSSDHNQPGDGFTATLAQPVVVDGIVVAERGQTISGRVVLAQKSSHTKGVSQLGVQLGELTLADGNPVPIKSELIARNNGRSVNGRDVGFVAGTTATGAAIGAMADWGTGAAVGAGIGAVGGILGVMLTRGRPTVLYPEQLLTFKIDEPVTVSTERAPQAFRYVSQEDYQQPRQLRASMAPPPAAAPAPYYSPYYYGYGPAYPYPYYGGPGFGFYWGPAYWGGFWGRGFWGRGFYGRGFRGFRR